MSKYIASINMSFAPVGAVRTSVWLLLLSSSSKGLCWHSLERGKHVKYTEIQCSAALGYARDRAAAFNQGCYLGQFWCLFAYHHACLYPDPLCAGSRCSVAWLVCPEFYGTCQNACHFGKSEVLLLCRSTMTAAASLEALQCLYACRM